jgi:hypothetical protein
MGRRRGGDKIHNKNKELKKSDFRRTTNNKTTIPDIIIACEDSVSSPSYFRMIVDNLIEKKIITQDSFVIAPHKHSNPMGVLDDLKRYKKEGKVYKDFDHRWIVIDRDSQSVNGGGHSKEDFNNALKNAKSKKSNFNIEVAYANDSFELWYLLHFEYRNSAISRDDILSQVIKRLKELDAYKFAKLSKDNIKQENYTRLIFETLKPLQSVAIRNAKKLLDSYGDEHNPESDNPSTRVHLLVEVLNGLVSLRE